MFQKLEKFFLKNVLRRKYLRKGSCLGCGACCEHIYVRHARNVIQSEEEFKKLRLLHPFYTYLEVVDKDEIGLVFICTNLDEKTKHCKIHKSRPAVCRRYPQEEIFLMGGELKKDCGYAFSPIESFDEVFEQVKKKGS